MCIRFSSFLKTDSFKALTEVENNKFMSPDRKTEGKDEACYVRSYQASMYYSLSMTDDGYHI